MACVVDGVCVSWLGGACRLFVVFLAIWVSCSGFCGFFESGVGFGSEDMGVLSRGGFGVGGFALFVVSVILGVCLGCWF